MDIKKKIWRLISTYDSIVIFRHVGPDGDAYGSQMGLKHLILGNFPKKQVLTVGKPDAHWEEFFGPVDREVSDETIQNSLAIVLDTANKARVDDQRFRKAKRMIKIDHHVFVESFRGQAEWVDTSYIATCEMIAALAIDLKLSINAEAAAKLYAGLVTDSGRFLYDSTSPSTLRMAATLLESGAEMNQIYDFLYRQEEHIVRFKGYLQLNFSITPNGVAYFKNTPEILSKFQMEGEQAGVLVNSMSGVIGTHMHVLFSQTSTGKVKVDFRSKKIAVNEIAKKYGGGGHKLASGALVDNWDVVDFILEDLDRLCAEKGNA